MIGIGFGIAIGNGIGHGQGNDHRIRNETRTGIGNNVWKRIDYAILLRGDPFGLISSPSSLLTVVV
jgi:hypothetical protein